MRDITVEEGGTVIISTMDLNTTGIWEFLSLHRGRGGNAIRPPKIRLQLTKLPKFG